MSVRRFSRALLALMLCAACVTVASAAAQTAAPTSERAGSDCDQQEPEPYTGTKIKADLNDQVFTLAIGRERSDEVSDELLIATRDNAELPAGGTSLSGEPVGSLQAVEGEGTGRIDRDRITVGVTVTGTTIVVNACIDPEGVTPGRYSGKVLVTGGEIEPFYIGTSATVQASGFVGWAVFALLAGAVGFALRTIANLAQLAENPPKKIGQEAKRKKREVHIRDVWPAYRRDRLIFVASVVVAAGSALGAWYASYWTDETFGDNNLGDYLELGLAALVASAGGTTLADLISAFKYKTED